MAIPISNPITVEDLNRLLVQAADAGFAEATLQGERRILLMTCDHRGGPSLMRWGTDRVLTDDEVGDVITRIAGTDASNRLRAGHEVTGDHMASLGLGRRRHRFKFSATGLLRHSAHGAVESVDLVFWKPQPDGPLNA